MYYISGNVQEMPINIVQITTDVPVQFLLHMDSTTVKSVGGYEAINDHVLALFKAIT